MSSGVIAIVLCAALMHALWNALIKGAGDRTVMLGLIALGHVIPGFALALNLPAPDPSSWVFIALSTVIHWGYYYLLNLAYRSGGHWRGLAASCLGRDRRHLGRDLPFGATLAIGSCPQR